MDIRNVANNGGVEHGSSRSKRAEATKAVLIPTPPRDEARISSESRETAAAIANLAERARNLPSERSDIVANAMTKLLGGELDSEAAMTGTARRLLDSKFLSA